MGMATTTTPPRERIERDLKFPLLLANGESTVTRVLNVRDVVDNEVVNAQTMRLVAEVNRLRMLLSRPDLSGEPMPGMIAPESTGTAATQRWEVLCAYRRWRVKGLDSQDALAMVRMSRVLELLEVPTGLLAAVIKAELFYIDEVLAPRVKHWNHVRTYSL